MKISSTQRDDLGTREFISRIVVFLREQAPNATKSMRDEDLYVVANHGISVARTYGLTTEQHLVEFTLDMLTIHPRFHEQQDIQAVLNDRTKGAEERMRAILSGVPESAWDQAEAYPDADLYWREVFTAAAATSGEIE